MNPSIRSVGFCFAMQFRLHKTLFLQLLPAFILAVVIGTLHHETGHFLAAKCMGLKASIHYNYTHVEAAHPFETPAMRQIFWFTLAGPLQTMLTGTAALLLLYVFKRRQRLTAFRHYLLLLIALFWIRQPVDFSLALLQNFSAGKYLQTGDEAKLSLYFHLPVWSLHAATAAVGIIVITIIIFRFVPAPQRFTFWLASSIGGAAGFFLWMGWLGKYILP